MPVKFPGPTDRVAVIGRTGSGKTTAGMWHLSGKNFRLQPWVIYNTKGDPLIDEIAGIPGVQTIDITETPGEQGLYIYNTIPSQGLEIDASLRRIWEKQNCGVFIDEGYMIDEQDAFNACLTQGRSRRIPMIVLSQRPAWISKFVFSESDFVHLFQLQIADDKKKIAGLVPVDKDYRLARYCSYWYNVGDNELTEFGPVPDKSVILDSFRASFPPEQVQITEGVSPSPQPVTLKRVV